MEPTWSVAMHCTWVAGGRRHMSQGPRAPSSCPTGNILRQGWQVPGLQVRAKAHLALHYRAAEWTQRGSFTTQLPAPTLLPQGSWLLPLPGLPRVRSLPVLTSPQSAGLWLPGPPRAQALTWQTVCFGRGSSRRREQGNQDKRMGCQCPEPGQGCLHDPGEAERTGSGDGGRREAA